METALQISPTFIVEKFSLIDFYGVMKKIYSNRGSETDFERVEKK